MIYTTLGHENGIGFETFLKSYITLSKRDQAQFILCTDEKVIKKYLIDYGISFSLKDNLLFFWGTQLKIKFVVGEYNYHSQASIDLAISHCLKSDVLLTLPTSKDQLNYQRGHTELFRHLYPESNISMNFYNSIEQVLLLTDHIPLREVPLISDELIVNQIKSSLDGYNKHFGLNFKHVLIAGINPHAGENGLIGNEDKKISEAILQLNKIYQDKIQFIGPLSGDTLHTFDHLNALKVYSHHDQGLSYFKGKHHFYGINISFGLPFIRLSVDHGTAFEMYGKNIANYSGSILTLETAVQINQRVQK